eukprot:4560349-Pleurochrysis_carterae.AAC.5
MSALHDVGSHPSLSTHAPCTGDLQGALVIAFFLLTLRIMMTTALSRLFGLYIQRRGPQPGLKANAAEEAALRCWYMIIHVVMSAAGLLLCMPRDWLTGSGGEIFYRLPWPHGPADDAVLSFYLVSSFLPSPAPIAVLGSFYLPAYALC